jgi:hypothetical protein
MCAGPFGQEIEEVPGVNEACQSFLDDSEEGSSAA